MIEVRDLKKSFGGHAVLNGVSFRIENGESVAIIGRSGCGKSVLLKHLIGLLKPDAGEVLIDGENIVPMNERQLLRVRRKFGMVFQGSALFDSMTVAENVGFGLRRHEHLTESGNRPAGRSRSGCGGSAGHRKQKPGGIVRRHEKTRRPGARHCLRTANCALRRTDDRPGPDCVRQH